jgi:TolB protein
MSYTHFAHTQPVWIGRVGSTELRAARVAAKDLLTALTYSENKFTESYGSAVPPGLVARMAETRRRLARMANE